MSRKKSSQVKSRRPSNGHGPRRARASDQITPRPEQRRQLEGRDVLVFWRDGDAPGRRRGLALSVDTCPSEQCTCRVVKLDGVVIADDSATLTFERDVLRVQRWASSPVVDHGKPRIVVVDLDLETGELEPRRDDHDPDLIAWLATEVDDELLDRLHERWRLGKGWPGRNGPRRQIDLRGWPPGELLGFHEVFDGERYDRFVVGDASYWAYTLLCPTPGCDCAAAEVQFGLADTEDTADVGAVQVDLSPTADPVADPHPEPGMETLLAGLWRRFAARHAVAPYLLQRQARMRMAWPAIEQALRAVAEVSTA